MTPTLSHSAKTTIHRALGGMLLGLALAPHPGSAAEAKVDFIHQVWPILKDSCLECHGSEKQKGKLRLDHRTEAFKGGKNGPVIQPGKAEESALYRRLLLPKTDDERMPNEGDPLPPEKLNLIRDWINQGATWPEESPSPTLTTSKTSKPHRRTDLEYSDAELQPADRPVSEVIDHYIEARLAASGVEPAPAAEDATQLRRLTLDLAGRIPLATEARAYADCADPKKREQTIDRLLSSPWFTRHLATELNLLLRGADATGPDLRSYLLKAVQEKRPWLQIFRELLGETPETPGPEQFLTKRLADPDLLTRDLSAVLFGINLSCCQCHTHPYVETLTQDYFVGMKNFFTRSYEFQGTLREKQFAPGQVEYKTPAGKTMSVGLKFINGSAVDAPQPNVRDLAKAIQDENKRIEDLKKNFEKTKEYPPEVFFSVRRQFVQTAERSENQRLLARSIVNRIWHRYLGYGLVMRVDQMHSENPPSHPELLAWLTRDFIAHNWDLRRLIRGIVSSRCYGRSTRWASNTPPPKDQFAVANLRPLTPMQFGLSVVLLGNSEFSTPRIGEKGEELDRRISQLETNAVAAFEAVIDPPRDGFQIDMDEPLGMSNDPDRLRLISSQLAGHLLKQPTRRAQIETAVWEILGRAPSEREYELLGRHLTRQSTVAQNERAEQAAAANAISSDITSRSAIDQLVWTLVAGAEFRFNH